MNLFIPGVPVGKGRPRFVRATGRMYTPPDTVEAEERIREVWRLAGAEELSGALSVSVVVCVPRPKGHYLQDGFSLSAHGRRHPHPDNQKPDLDNVVKLILDALNGHAFKDDVQVVVLNAYRFWKKEAFTTIDIKEWTHA